MFLPATYCSIYFSARATPVTYSLTFSSAQASTAALLLDRLAYLRRENGHLRGDLWVAFQCSVIRVSRSVRAIAISASELDERGCHRRPSLRDAVALFAEERKSRKQADMMSE